MFIIKLALRNLFRHKKRTIITAIVISLAIFIYLLSDSLMLGIEELSYANIINLESGHLQVVNPDYWEERQEAPLENLIPLTEDLKKKIREIEGFNAMAGQLRFSASLNNGIDEIPIMGLGINPEEIKRVLTIDEYFVEGSMLTPGKYEAVLGKSLADLMDLKVGDYLTLIVRTKENTFNTIDAVITGLLKTPHPDINDNTVFVPLDIARQALNLEEEISQIVIRLNRDKEEAREIAAELSRNLAEGGFNLKAYSWQESAETLTAMMQMQDIENFVILGIILVIAAVGIINTTILSAIERMEEIGMMKALGLKEGEIIRVFMIEATGIGIIGGLIGCFFGGIGVTILNQIGLSMNTFGGQDTTYGLPILDKIYGGWNPGAFIFVFVFGVVIALLSSILPARWAARKDPVKAIYHR